MDNVELWIKELTDAGWEKVMATVWKCPAGPLFRGPYRAWQLMKTNPELSVARLVPPTSNTSV